MFELAADCNDCDITSMERHFAAPISVKDWLLTLILSGKLLFDSSIAAARSFLNEIYQLGIFKEVVLNPSSKGAVTRFFSRAPC